MGLAKRLRAEAGAMAKRLGLVSGTKPNTVYYVGARQGTSQASPQQLIARDKGWVYACASRNATAVARTPLRLYVAWPGAAKKRETPWTRRPLSDAQTRLLEASCPSGRRWIRQAGQVEEITDHPFLDLLYFVNPLLNQFELLELVSLSLDLTGHAYLYVVSNKLGTPQEIWPLLPQYLRPGLQEGYYSYGSGVQRLELPKQDVIHARFGDLRGLESGLGPLEAVTDAADLSFDMARYEQALLKNNARPDFFLVAQGELSPAAYSRLVDNWQVEHGGIERSGRVGLLEGGVTVEKLSFSPKEMAFLQGRKVIREELAAAFSVPLSKLTVDDVNRANAEAGNYSFALDSISPRLLRIEFKLNQMLLPRYDPKLFCAFDDPVPESRDLKLREDEVHLRYGVKTVNEVRRDKGLPDVAWGNEPMAYVSHSKEPAGAQPAAAAAAATE